MKIIASIPVERIQRTPYSYSYRHELHEVDVIRVVRAQATRYPHLNRWHYKADIKDHPSLLIEAKHSQREYRVNIFRKGLNPKWKPPEFGNSNVYVVEDGE